MTVEPLFSAAFTWARRNKMTSFSQKVVPFADTEIKASTIASDSASGQTLTYTAAGLPPGLSMNSSTGLISGTTPSTAGNFTVTVTVTGPLPVSATFNWVVYNSVAVTNPGNQAFTTGATISLQIKASDSGRRALAYGAAGLPPGLSMNSSTCLPDEPVRSLAVTVAAKESPILPRVPEIKPR